MGIFTPESKKKDIVIRSFCFSRSTRENATGHVCVRACVRARVRTDERVRATSKCGWLKMGPAASAQEMPLKKKKDTLTDPGTHTDTPPLR